MPVSTTEVAVMCVRMGLDFGGVIVKNRNRMPGEDTGMSTCAGEEIAQPGVFEAVRELIRYSNGHVWIVSKAGPRMQSRTLAWLEEVAFLDRTGLAADKIRFCLEREDKERVCRDLGLAHFVDDRVHVMQILRHAVPNLYLFGEEPHRRCCPPWATFVTDWGQIAKLVTGAV